MALERPRILMTLMMMTVMMMTLIVKTMMLALTKDYENDTNNGSNDGDGTEDSGFDNDLLMMVDSIAASLFVLNWLS